MACDIRARSLHEGAKKKKGQMIYLALTLQAALLVQQVGGTGLYVSNGVSCVISNSASIQLCKNCYNKKLPISITEFTLKVIFNKKVTV